MFAMRGAAFWLLAIAGIVCGAQPANLPHYVEIKIPRGVDSATVFIRYLLDGDFGGWVDRRPSVSSYFVATTVNQKAASRLRALVYAPGCAIQTYDLQISGSNVQQLAFNCQPVPPVWFSGIVTDLRDSRIVAKYTGPWVQDFFSLPDGIVTFIPVGEANYFTDQGRFHILIPDFSGADRPGEIQFWAKDPSTGNVLARLVPAAHSSPGSPAPGEIKFVVCGTQESRHHDRFGFSTRDAEDACP